MENNKAPQKITFTLKESLTLIEFMELKEHFFNGYTPNDLMKNWHFKEFYFKLYKAVVIRRNDEKINLKINEIERYVMSIFLNNFELNPLLLCVESNLINGLVKIN
jgi:hypothetical protein